MQFSIQTCIGRFFQTVEKEFEIGRVETPKYLERFLNNSILLNSFFSELLPHILISLDKQPSTECTAWHYSDGLTESFKRSAWRTQRTTSPNNFNRGDINVITCPFSGFIKDLWDTVYVENDEGVLSPTTLKQDGAFPVMVASRLLELESSSPQLRPLSFIK
jgi:hypothetical protein